MLNQNKSHHHLQVQDLYKFEFGFEFLFDRKLKRYKRPNYSMHSILRLLSEELSLLHFHLESRHLQESYLL
jgi:hypothetical protein